MSCHVGACVERGARQEEEERRQGNEPKSTPKRGGRSPEGAEKQPQKHVRWSACCPPKNQSLGEIEEKTSGTEASNATSETEASDATSFESS